jgi:hypothetical protein
MADDDALDAVRCPACGSAGIAGLHRCAPRPEPVGVTARVTPPEPLVLDPREAPPPVLPVGASADADMRVLGRVLPWLLGRAAGLEPVVRGRVRTDRPDHLDHHHHDLDHARRVLDRLAALDAGDALVLHAVAHDLDVHAIGLAFVDDAQRRRWLVHERRRVRDALPHAAGLAFVARAGAAYVALPRALPAAPHDALGGLERALAARVGDVRRLEEAAAAVNTRVGQLRWRAGREPTARDALRALAERTIARFLSPPAARDELPAKPDRPDLISDTPDAHPLGTDGRVAP